MDDHLKDAFVCRANIITNSSIDPYAVAISQNVFGLGWPVDGGRTGLTWRSYKLKAEQKYAQHVRKWTRHLEFLREQLAVGDFVWIRDKQDQFHLGRIEGAWRYSAAAENKDADLVNIRSCRWKAVTDLAVPGEIRECRGLFRFINRGEAYLPILKLCMSLYHGTPDSVLSHSAVDLGNRLFTGLSPQACEDLVGLYLQKERGYSVIASTCKHSGKTFEFKVIHRETGEEAGVQVKKGRSCVINLDSYRSHPFRVFTFIHGGRYVGTRPAHVEKLNESELINFSLRSRESLPPTIRNWVGHNLPE